MKKSSLFLLTLFVLSSFYLFASPFQPSDIFKMKSVGEVEISPDGHHIAYTLTVPRPLEDGEGSSYRELYLYNLKTETSRPFLTGNVFIYNIGWSPDSRYILFLGKLNEAEKTTLYKMPVDGGGAIPYVKYDQSILDWNYSPDGKYIAFTSYDPGDSLTKAVRKKGFKAEIYEEEWRHRNLYLFDTQTEEIKQLTNDITIFDFIWHPEGKQLVVAAAEKNLVDYRYMFKKLKVVSISDGNIEPLLDNPGKLGKFIFNPKGTKLALISAVDIYDPREGSIYVIDFPNQRKFNELKNHSQDFQGTVTDIDWVNNTTLIYSADEGTETAIHQLNLKKNRDAVLLKPGNVIVSAFSLVDKQLAFSGDTPFHPDELYTFHLNKKELKKRTEHNEWLSEKDFGKQETIVYQTGDGLKIEGVLIYPLNYDSKKRYPLINVIHGGPESCFHNGWVTSYSRWGQIAASKGYAVFMPNYRGSTGRGVAFSRMDQKDLAGKEFEDILAGIDFLIGKGLVDGERVGIGGGSYGGYLSAWAATRYNQRFAAAVVFVGISDQISKRNTTDIPYEAYYVHWRMWTDEDFKLVWDRSPVKWAAGSVTPTLILHGKNDPRVHPSQSLELYRKLKIHGKAPVRLVYYPGEGHGNRLNTNRWDFLLRTLEWFDTFLGKNGASAKIPEKFPGYNQE